ncbi:MAG: cation-translocating P-type ATPase [Candidatus Obscuribacterales bacterium]|nr:cation-translocating P-type ATPase [Candidatus Obscuribacterales bacterium]
MSKLLEESNSVSLHAPWLQKLDEPLEAFVSIDESGLLALFGSDKHHGLSENEALERTKLVGENKSERKSGLSAIRIFLHQFQSSVVALLLLAALASAFYHEMLQAVGILAAVFINAITGFYMEFKAGASLAALQELTGQTCRVVRGSGHDEISVSRLVPGDLLILEAGNRVPADLRLIESAGMTVDESTLTGESQAVQKDAVSAAGETHNILYHGTLVSAGRGRAIVLKTGARSSMGKLSKLLDSTETGATPLENQLEDLGKQLSVLTVIICTIVSAVGIFHQENLLLMVETGIALAVAAIPEGLPVLATLALAVGTQRMVRNKAILRHLAAVETLGCTSIICTDKTGTLTENQMCVSKLYIHDQLIEVTGNGYAPSGEFLAKDKRILVDKNSALNELLIASALCNDASLENDEAEEGWHVHGDPTEGALLSMAAKGMINRREIAKKMPRVAEFPFDLNRKRMSTIHQRKDNGLVAYVKGSPGAMIKLCSKILKEEGRAELNAEMQAELLSINEKFAQEGLRVLAVAKKELDVTPLCLDLELVETDLCFIALVAIKDPPREGVKEAVSLCKGAGIKVLMLTGDQALTAEAIARELGILGENSPADSVITGTQLETMSEQEQKVALNKASVLARVSPELKLAIVKSMQADGSIVSMTGDGVNDAPALKQAHIGVAMGRNGTDLARSVSQMVITDDNFSTIVKAIEQGRIIYGNIQRAVGYLLTASLASVITVALGIVFDIGLALSPLQLLWLNLIMHIFPGLGIVLQRADSSMMQQKPRDPKQKLISEPQYKQIGIRSLLVSLSVLFALEHGQKLSTAFDHTSTIGLTTLSFALLFQAWSWLGVKERHSVNQDRTEIGPGMVLNMLCAYALLFAAIYLPVLREVLNTVPLSFHELLFSAAVAGVPFIITTVGEHFLNLRRNSILTHPKG